jgi:CTP synthase (UTP-ammonia lyase)
VLRVAEAEHAEDSPGAATLLITPVACPVPNRAAGAPNLSGTMTIFLREGSRARALYGEGEAEEGYFCNYELNPMFRSRFESGGLPLTGEDETGQARLFESPTHPFFIGTLFQPQRASIPGRPHPLIAAFVREAAAVHRT